MTHLKFLVVGILLSGGLLFTSDLNAQAYVDMMINPDGYTFEEIVDTFNEFAKGKDPRDVPYFNQFRRWELRHSRRLGEDGRMVNADLKNYLAHQRIQSSDMRAPGGFWTEVGPTNYTLGTHGTAQSGGMGRVNCIAFHPTNNNIVFIGTPAGGLWKSTNNGTSWTSLTDGLPVIGVSGIAIKESNPNVMYILTGDGDASDTYSMGILKSVNGGASWYQTGPLWDVNDKEKGYKLLNHPSNGTTFYIASSDGLYKTSNGGQDWDMVQFGDITDIEFRPESDSVMYAVRRSPGQFYKSEDAGDTWEVYPGATLPTSDFSRIAIAVTPDWPSMVYLLFGGGSTGFKGLYRSSDNGDNWALRSNTPNIMSAASDGSGTNHQANYDIALAVDPADYTEVFVGGINIWKSSNGGTAWTLSAYRHPEDNAWGYVHADIHALEFNNSIIYAGCDGGRVQVGRRWWGLGQYFLRSWYPAVLPY